jgi:hypothetical protein
VVKLGALALQPTLNGGLLGERALEAVGLALGLPAGVAVRSPVGAQLALRFPLQPLPTASLGSVDDDGGQVHPHHSINRPAIDNRRPPALVILAERVSGDVRPRRGRRTPRRWGG